MTLATETATTALVVACISAGFSLCNLVWQFFHYRLAGARLSVTMRPAVLGILCQVIRGPAKGWPRTMPPIVTARDQLENGFVDLVEIQVANRGRTPVTVSDISLDTGWKKWPWWRQTTAGRLVPAGGGLSEARTVRLEPGDFVTVYMDLLPLLAELRQRQPRLRSLRASARAAGRRPTRSPRRHRWRLSGSRSAGWPYPPAITPEIEAFRKVFRVVYPRDLSKLYESWVGVGAAYMQEDDGNGRRLVDRLQEAMADPLGLEVDHSVDVVIAALDLARTYEGPERQRLWREKRSEGLGDEEPVG